MISAHFRPFDVPLATGATSDPAMMLVGVPAPQLGQVQAAWSAGGVRSRAPRFEGGASGPALGLGGMGGMLGAILALVAFNSPSSMLPLILGLGLVGWTLGRRLATASRRVYATYFVGAAGIQKNEVRGDAIATETYEFGDHSLLVSRTRYVINGHDRGVGMLTRLVGADGTVTIPPLPIGDALIAAMTRFRFAQPSESLRFAVYELPRGPAKLRQVGHISVARDRVEIADGAQAKAAMLHELRCTLGDGQLEFSWPADRARIRLDTIAEADTLIAILHQHGVLPAWAP
jgi:hypothetical protein